MDQWRFGLLCGFGVCVGGALAESPTMATYQRPPATSVVTWFGVAVASTEEFAIVRSRIGTTDKTPRIDTYRWVPDPLYGGLWVGTGTLAPPGGYSPTTPNESPFPHGLAIQGEVACVGATSEVTEAGADAAGAVFLFEQKGTIDEPTWQYLQTLAPDSLTAGDQFGADVAVDGATLVASAPYSDEGAPQCGRVFVFEQDALTGTWNQAASLGGSPPMQNQLLGLTSDLSGDWVVASSGGIGSATVVLADVFHRSTSGEWGFEQAIETPSGRPVFGKRYVAMEGEMIAVGVSTVPDLWIYQWSAEAGVWSHTGTLPGPTGNGGCRAVEVSGSMLVAGFGGEPGSAAVYRMVEGAWSQEREYTSPSLVEGDAWFGRAVSVTGAGVLIGAPAFDFLNPASGTMYSEAFAPDCDANGLTDPLQTSCVQPDISELVNGGLSVLNFTWLGDDTFFLTLNRVIVPHDNLVLDAVRVQYAPSAVPVGESFTVVVYIDPPDVEGIADAVLLHESTAVKQHDSPRHPEFVDLADLPFQAGDALLIGTVSQAHGPPPHLVTDGLVGDGEEATGYTAGAKQAIRTGSLSLATPVLALDAWHIDAVFNDGSDCNDNGIPDHCDIESGFSLDLDLDGLPDECFFDCNGNGEQDAVDIAAGGALDCNANGVPDSCEIAAGALEDCDGDGVPDPCAVVPLDYPLTDLRADATLSFSFNNFDLLTINQFTVSPAWRPSSALASRGGLRSPRATRPRLRCSPIPIRTGTPLMRRCSRAWPTTRRV